MRIVSIVGTRPQIIKAAALSPVLRERHHEVFVDTGQHYDETMAGALFTELGLARPDVSLGVGSGTHAAQTAAILAGAEGVLVRERPDAVLVYGDTNSTLAGALAAAKLGLPVAHVEAGLRSFDRSMPEEINRVLVDHLATWCFAPTPAAVANLAAEGIRTGIELVGDLMQDLAARVSQSIREPGVLPALKGLPLGVAGELKPGAYLYATVHRAENREPTALVEWARLLSAVARSDRPVLLSLHPGTRAALAEAGLELGPAVVVSQPLGYRTSLALQLHAAAVITDSGGVQREAAWLGTPCLVLRDRTEWVETVAGDEATSLLIGRDPLAAQVALERLAPADATGRQLAVDRAASLALAPAGAAGRIRDALAQPRPTRPGSRVE
jgi:UDP-N-acetylglucosamine 2-epimerase